MTGTLCRLLAHFQDGSEAQLHAALIQPNVAQFQVQHQQVQTQDRSGQSMLFRAPLGLVQLFHPPPSPPLHFDSKEPAGESIMGV